MSRGGAPAVRISDIGGIEVEHLLGLVTGKPLVKVRVLDRNGQPVALGQVTPAEARSIAEHLAECAARAEYELDLTLGAAAAGMPADAAVQMITMVRNGQRARHEGPNQ